MCVCVRVPIVILTTPAVHDTQPYPPQTSHTTANHSFLLSLSASGVRTVTASRVPVLLLFAFSLLFLIILYGQKLDIQPQLKGKPRVGRSGSEQGSWCVTWTGGRDGWMREATEGEPTWKINLHSQLLLRCNHWGSNGQRLWERPERGRKNTTLHLHRYSWSHAQITW